MDLFCGYLFIFLIVDCIIGMDIFGSWKNFYIGFLVYGVRVIVVWKVMWKVLKLFLF